MPSASTCCSSTSTSGPDGRNCPSSGTVPAGYGDAAAFRHGLQARGLNYVVGISTTLSAHPADAVPVAEPYSGSGRPPVAKYPDKPQPVKELVIAAGPKAARRV
ncbi:transposase, partial [Streptomyces avermitilis]